MSDHTLQKKRVLQHLKSYPSIDPWSCARLFGFWKLSTIIGGLRRDGHYIEDAWRKTDKSRYKVYFLVKASRKAA